MTSVTGAGILIALLGIVLVLIVAQSWWWVILVGVIVAVIGAFVGRGRTDII